jgi:Rieske Fe-S protein
VATVTDTINCDCHGGKFSIEDGSVVGGPALAPLRSETVTVQGTDLVLE